MPAAIKVSLTEARRFMRRALLLDEPVGDVATALAHHGYIQIDPINVCGRMHDLILRNRVAGYCAGDLHRHVHSAARPAYEHYLPGATHVLVAFPLESWPMLAARIRAHRLRGGPYGRPLAATHERLARRILDEMAERGALTSDDIEHAGRARTGWGTPGRLAKNVLERLFVQGRVLIAARRNFRRVYDLPERVLPARILAADSPSPDETARWLVMTNLRQRRLVLLKRKDLPLVQAHVQAVQVPGCPTLHCLRSDLPWLDLPLADADRMAKPLLLPPLDPLIYDRRLTALLWGFDYIWEAYTPPARRRLGYYALPVLAATELVGHVDPKADRAGLRLQVMSRRIRRGVHLRPALESLAGFLGLRL